MAGRQTIKTDGVKVTLAHLNNDAEWTQIYPLHEIDRDDITKLYNAVPWLYRGIEYRALSVAELPFVWVRGENEEEDTPEYRRQLGLPEFDPRYLLNVIEAWRTMYGAAYVWKDLRASGRMMGIRPMHPGTIKPVIDGQQGLIGWKRQLGGKETEYEREAIAYSWVPPRHLEIGPGTAPAEAALQAAGVLRHVSVFASTFFERGTIMPTIVSVVDAIAGDEELSRLQTFLKRAVSGINNAFRIQALSADVKFNQLGQPVKDLAMPELTEQAREDVATALGIPQSILFSNAANFAVAEQDALHFYNMTIVPEAEAIAEALNRQVFEPYNVELKFKPELLEIYQAQEARKAERLVALVRAGIIDKNEARTALNMEPRDDLPEMPMLPPGNPPPNMPDEPRDVTPSEREEDIRRWRDKAIRRFDEGKPDKALEFESDHIPATLKGYLQGALEVARTADDVQGIFEMATHWEGYP